MKLTKFDMSKYLNSNEAVEEYLNQVLADGDSGEFIRAIGHIAKAKGMSAIAKDTGLGRESLYKAFSGDANPRFDTVVKVMKALGVKLHTQILDKRVAL